MNEKKKRTLVVPVMMLAICAIAMIELGFSISTSVSSENNAVEKLMVDLNNDSSDLNNATEPLADSVNGLLNIELSTDKKVVLNLMNVM